MKTINKTFKTFRQAERYQLRLYSQYDRVDLVRAPRFCEEGIYTWQVK
jgi:hypothetical protein